MNLKFENPRQSEPLVKDKASAQAEPERHLLFAETHDTAADSRDPANEEFQKALTKIVRRCEAAKIQFEYVTNAFERRILAINMPAGRRRQLVKVTDHFEANRLLDSNFQKYSFVGDYDAICSYEDGYIEALLS